MFCTNCGTKCDDNVTVCPNCGKPLGAQATNSTANAQSTGVNGTPTINFGANAGQNNANPNFGANNMNQNFGANPNYASQSTGMGWFKFIIYFQLIVGPIILVIQGISTIAGLQYGGSASLVYAFFGSLKVLDIFMGLIMIAFAVFGVFTRQLLVTYKKNGPLMLYVYFGAQLIVTLLYVMIASAIIKQSAFSGTLVFQFIVSIAFLAIDVVYFNKRKDIFIN